MSQLGPRGETQEAFNSPGLTLAALLGRWIRVPSVCPSVRARDATRSLRGILSGPGGFSDTGKGGSEGDGEDGGNRTAPRLHEVATQLGDE